MNKLSKEKREKLILTIIGICGVLGLLYTFVLGAQKDELRKLEAQLTGVQDKLAKAERLVRNAESIQEELAVNRAELEKRQAEMAPSGQYYYWFLKMLDGFRQEEKLDNNFILDVTQPEFASVGLIPDFPYQAGYFGVRVTGQFQEIGRFFAGLENKYPYMRIQNVKLQPQIAQNPGSEAGTPAATDKIIAEFKIVTLFNPGTI